MERDSEADRGAPCATCVEKHPHYKNVKFVLQDAAGDVSSLGGPDRYDTVIQSMGLCSVHEPIQLLHNLEAVCKKDGGKIILLEHGRSYYEWLNKILDRVAPIHAKEWGCW